MSPAVWVSIVAEHRPAATAAADPALDPPGVRSAAHGLRVGAGSLSAHSVHVVLPTIAAPAARARATTGASRATGAGEVNAEPARVGIPATSITSLTPNVTPSSGRES